MRARIDGRQEVDEPSPAQANEMGKTVQKCLAANPEDPAVALYKAFVDIDQAFQDTPCTHQSQPCLLSYILAEHHCHAARTSWGRLLHLPWRVSCGSGIPPLTRCALSTGEEWRVPPHTQLKVYSLPRSRAQTCWSTRRRTGRLRCLSCSRVESVTVLTPGTLELSCIGTATSCFRYPSTTNPTGPTSGSEYR